MHSLFKDPRPEAALILSDGTVLLGRSFGASVSNVAEVVFNTAMTGYQEVLTDPSYTGQIVTLTGAHVGNVGVNAQDREGGAAVHAAGLVVRDVPAVHSNFRSEKSLPDYLVEQGVPAIAGVDTRRLTRILRTKGAQAGVIVVARNGALTEDEIDAGRKAVAAWKGMAGQDLAKVVTCKAPYEWTEGAFSMKAADGRPGFVTPAELPVHVVAYDFGVKTNILRMLVERGMRVTVVPAQTPVEDVLAMNPDGVFLSNGPGDPDAVPETYTQVQQLIGRVPVFGICLGHQMISLAAGAQIEKLKFGHRGGNQPVMNLLTRRVEITAQNHGFGLVFPSLGALVPELSGGVAEHPTDGDLRFWVERGIAPVVENERFGRIRLTHVNLNDGTAEGIQLLDAPCFSVQYHPEASPGPTDAHYLFTAFARLMAGEPDYLSIDIAADRLAGWNFATEEN